MSADTVISRILCSRARVSFSDFRQGAIDDNGWARLYEAGDYLAQAPFFVDETPSSTVDQIRDACLLLKSDNNLGLVVVDYLQLMRSDLWSEPREQQLCDITRRLKYLSKEIETPIVAVSQLNRKAEERTDKRPRLSDMRDSGAIEDDADLVMFIYRDAVYNDIPDNPKANIAEIIIAKHRNGPLGFVELYFDKEYTAFRNISRGN